MSHTNEKGMVVGKRYMLTYKNESLTKIYILKYSDFLVGAERDKYELEYSFNVNTGELDSFTSPNNIGYVKNVGPIIDVIDMEKIEKEIEKEMDAVAIKNARTGEGDEQELYFKACLKIYNRLTGKSVRVTQGPFKKFSGEDLDDDTDIKDPVDFLIARRTKREEEERKLYESVYGPYETGGRNLEGARRGGGKKRKSKKRKRRKSKKKKSKTRRRRR